LLETILAAPLVALRIRWLAPLYEERANGKVYTRRELRAGYGVFVVGFLLASAIFMAAFFFMILKVSLDFAVLGDGLRGLVPFLLISFVTDLVLRRPLTMPQAERLAEGSMGRIALLFLAVFCGVWDHLVFPWEVGDPWVILSAVASATEQIKLVTGVAPLPRYRPHLLARLLTALDRLSNGRMIFGTGLGIASDFTPFAEPGDAKIRAEMTDEGLDLLTKLWSGKEITHQGQHYTAEGVRFLPSPVQRPRIPIWIGGDSPAALRRAARWDGWIMGTINEQCEITKTPHQIAEQVATIHQQRTAATPFAVAVDGASEAVATTLVREYEAAGATWWFEAIFTSRATMDALLARIKAGPPR